MRRVIGMDIHRTFAEVVFWEDGKLRPAGRVSMTRAGLEVFGRSLGKEDEVVIEATGNAMAVVRVLSPYVGRVIVANPLQVKAIAHAHVKTDKIDAGVLASLRAADFLPEIWLPDADTERRRRLVARRNQVVRHRTRIKNEVHAILHAHLVPPCPHAELFGRLGRIWLSRQIIPDDEAAAIDRHLCELDGLGEDLAGLDREIAQTAVDDPAVKRLLTITGVNLIVAAGLVAAIGDIRRFADPQKLVSYVGLNPRVRQSGLGLAQHGRISKRGRSHARAMLVKAAWAGQGARPAACFLLADPRPSRPPDCGGRRRPQAGRAVLAPADQEYRLPMGTPSAGREQDAVNGAASRPTGQERKQARPGLCLQHQGAARPRNRARPPCRTSLRAVREPMAAAWQLNPAHGCRKRGATLRAARPGLHPRSRLFATRSPVQPKAITMVTCGCRGSRATMAPGLAKRRAVLEAVKGASRAAAR